MSIIWHIYAALGAVCLVEAILTYTMANHLLTVVYVVLAAFAWRGAYVEFRRRKRKP